MAVAWVSGRRCDDVLGVPGELHERWQAARFRPRHPRTTQVQMEGKDGAWNNGYTYKIDGPHVDFTDTPHLASHPGVHSTCILSLVFMRMVS